MALTKETPFHGLRRTWQPVASASELPPGEITGYLLWNVELVLSRFPDGRLLAADVACPHKGSWLSAGCLRVGELRCAYHGWRFDAEGRCQTIPSSVDPSPEKLALSQLRSYAVQDRYDLIWVKLELESAFAEARYDRPDILEFENDKWTYLLGPPMKFGAGWRRGTENYLDMSHFAFAHASTLGRAASSLVPEMEITLQADGGFQMAAPFPSLTAPQETPGKLQGAHRRRQSCFLPNFTTIRQSFPDGDERLLVHLPSPMTETSCTVFWALAISPNFRGPPPAQQIEFAVLGLEEDRQRCELQMPLEVPINPTRGGWGVLATPGDTLANTFQKCLRQWLQRRAP